MARGEGWAWYSNSRDRTTTANRPKRTWVHVFRADALVGSFAWLAAALDACETEEAVAISWPGRPEK